MLPIAVIALLGGAVGRWRNVSIASASALVFYLFSPALIFHSLSSNTLSADTSIKVVVVQVGAFAAMYGASALWSSFARHDSSMRAGFALTATTPNLGNMGLPVAQLAFGERGLELAVVNLIAGSMLANTAGIAIASRSRAGSRWLDTLRTPLRYPALYAAIAGLSVDMLDIALPAMVEVPTATLADAAVPVMLVVLGLQLQQAASIEYVRDLAALNVGRAVVAPIAAWLIATAIGLEGVTRATLVVLAAMPTAVVVTIIATEFDARPSFVTRAVVTSTVASLATLTVLITLLT